MRYRIRQQRQKAKLFLLFLLPFVTVVIIISVYSIRAGTVCHAGQIFPELINNFCVSFSSASGGNTHPFRRRIVSPVCDVRFAMTA